MLIGAQTEKARDPVAWRARAAFGRIALAPGRAAVVAVSGGGDSIALLHLVRAYLARERPGTPLIAATVDHGLRPESAAEARQVALACASLGIPHRTLEWDGARAATGLQAAARQARYRLLTGLARREGAPIVLTGHTADDQAETVAMRKARAPGGRGLSGIDRATLSQRAVWFARPLIDIGRHALRTWLSERGIGWIDDPGNDDRRFERVRVRAALTRAGQSALAHQGRTCAGERGRGALLGADCLEDRALWRVAERTLVFDPARAHAHRREALAAAMSGALAWTGCLERQPSLERATAALGFCAEAPNGAALTIAGCRLRKAGGLVRFGRDPRNRRDAAMRCFDVLLPLADRALADALARLHRAAPYPAPPFITTAAHGAQR